MNEFRVGTIYMPDAQRILSRAECEAIARRIYGFATGGGDTRVQIRSWWQGELRWGRNRVTLASDRRDVQITIQRFANIDQLGTCGVAATNQLDDESLRAAVQAAERWPLFCEAPPPQSFHPPRPPFEVPTSAIWSDATYGLTTEARAEAARDLIAPAAAKGMLSAGYVEARAATYTELSSAVEAGKPAAWETPHVAWTQAQCSMTVRDPKGTGSGWAGLSSHDWGRIDTPALAGRALEKCLASQQPVALEPGRYTVILEPQAVCDLVEPLMDFRRLLAEQGSGPFALAYDDVLRLWRTKLGLKVVDERVTLSHSYADPWLGIVPQLDRSPDEVKWIDRGVLKTLWYDRDYGLTALHEASGTRAPTGFRMSGGATSIEEMIRTTKRGLLVTRFSNVRALDQASLLATGLTRDGLWLIENGKISKAVKNFRFTESPLFVLNSLEQLGEPVPVFRVDRSPGGAPMPAVVPPLKARDFSFTSMIDAI